MNYLAHAYLSFMHEDVLVGNMISDFVKGKKQFDYPINIHKGITLHRAIDTFTDAHPITKEARKCFKDAVGSYSGAFVDVVYDHFLATDKETWQQIPLSEFSVYVYEMLEANNQLLPEKFQRMLPYMKTHNWLYNYQFTWGIEKSFEGVARRAVYLNDSSTAFECFLKHYSQLNTLASAFLIDVKKFAFNQFDQLLKA